MSYWNTGNPRGIGPTRYKNDAQLTAADIPGIIPPGGGLPPIPGVVTGDRPVPVEPPAQPDPSPPAIKEPIYIGTRPSFNTVTNIASIIGGDLLIPPGYTDYIPGSAFDPNYVEIQFEEPKPGRDEGIYWLFDNLDENPIAVAITGTVLGLVGNILGETTQTVIDYIADAPNMFSQKSLKIKGGQPSTNAKKQSVAVCTNVGTGLTKGDTAAASITNITATVSYSQIPVTATLMENTITLQSIVMDFPVVGPGNGLQLDIECTVAFDDMYFYPPNNDDVVVGEWQTAMLFGHDGAGVLFSTKAQVKMLGGIRGYRTNVHIIVNEFPTTASAISNGLTLSSVVIRYITRVDLDYVEEFIGLTV